MTLDNLNSLDKTQNSHETQPTIILALLLLLIGVSAAIHQFKVPPIMIQIGESVGMSADKAPWLMSIFMLVCLIFAIPAGTLVQRMNAKGALLFSAALVTAGSIIGSLSTTALPLLISRGVEGVGFLIISVAIPVAAVTHSDPKKIGMVMGICGVWISVGSIAAFNTAPVLMFRVGWHGVWWIYTVFTIVSMILFALGFKGRKALPPLEEESSSLLDAAMNKNLIFPSISFLIYNFILMSMITFFPGYATGAGLMQLNRASFIASLPMILSLAGSPIIGRLADSFSHKWLYSLTLMCAGIGATLMFSKNISQILIGAAILGLIGAATPGLMFSSLGKLVSKESLIAPSNGIVVLFQNMGMFLASLLFGSIAGAFGGSYTLASIILIPLAIVGTGLIILTDY